MGLFGKRRDKTAERRGGTTIIAEGSRFHGELNLEGKLHIDGRVEGTIHCRGDLSIGSKGHFEGELRAGRLVVSGELSGRIDCNTLEIVHGGRVQGEVSTAELIIEPGGRFIGESVRREEEVTAIIPETPVPAPHDTPEVGEIRGAEAEPQSRDDPLQGSVG